MADGGHDIVLATTTYTLPENLEDLELVTNTAIDGTGNARANTLRGNAFANRLDGQAGDDLLVGGAGGDTYVIARGSGHDVVVENDAVTESVDVVAFGTDIAADQLWFRQAGDHLEVSMLGSPDRLTIHDWFTADAHPIDQFQSGDGRTLLDSQVHFLVNAMAAFAPPPMGLASLTGPPGVYREALAPVLAARARAARPRTGRTGG